MMPCVRAPEHSHEREEGEEDKQRTTREYLNIHHTLSTVPLSNRRALRPKAHLGVYTASILTLFLEESLYLYMCYVGR
jgi:hypothetical protein